MHIVMYLQIKQMQLSFLLSFVECTISVRQSLKLKTQCKLLWTIKYFFKNKKKYVLYVIYNI